MSFPRTLLPLFILFLPPAAQAVGNSIAVQRTPEKITLGEPFEIQLMATYRGRYNLELSSGTQEMGSYLIVSAAMGTPETRGEEKVQKIILKAVAIEVGELPFPEIEWDIVDPWDGSIRPMKSPSIPFQVTAEGEVPGETDPIRDIKGPIHPINLLWLGLLLSSIMGIIYWLWTLFRQKKSLKHLQGTVESRPPHEEALAALVELEGLKLWESGDARGYYLRLSEILRRYLTERFGVDATRLTTRDLLVRLRAMNLDGIVGRRVSLVSESADLAKFAKVRPHDSRRAQDFDAVRTLVEETAGPGVLGAAP